MMRNHCPLLHMQRDISWLLLSIFPLSQPVLQGVAHKIETGGKKQRQFNRTGLTSSSAHVCAIGEVARSDGGVKKQKNDSVKRFLHSSPTVSRSLTGYSSLLLCARMCDRGGARRAEGLKKAATNRVSTFPTVSRSMTGSRGVIGEKPQKQQFPRRGS